MKRFIEGVDRGQSTLFPECLEDYIAEDNPVRVIDVFVDELDLGGLSAFSIAEALYLRLPQPGSVEPPP
jgi:transposase